MFAVVTAQASMSAQSQQVHPQQVPGQQLRNGIQQQGPALPRSAVSQPQLRVNPHQHPQTQVQVSSTGRPQASMVFPVTSQGAVKQEPAAGMQRQLSAQDMQHAQALPNGQQQAGMRPQFPSAQQHHVAGHQTQQGIQMTGLGQTQMHPNAFGMY